MIEVRTDEAESGGDGSHLFVGAGLQFAAKFCDVVADGAGLEVGFIGNLSEIAPGSQQLKNLMFARGQA